MPVDSDASERGGGAARGGGADPTAPRTAAGERELQRDGVLSVERHRKADGRALLLYRWVDADGAPLTGRTANMAERIFTGATASIDRPPIHSPGDADG
ncbi:MAG TPA: hypothetical protein VNV37_08175 [Solirubrobacteraceae bacterium]|jgi:hypothetical protein|nr:hypothetical protein [Solirubrobacteraceae bacterium]